MHNDSTKPVWNKSPLYRPAEAARTLAASILGVSMSVCKRGDPTAPAAGMLSVFVYGAGWGSGANLAGQGLPLCLLLLLNEADPSRRRRPPQWFKDLLLGSLGCGGGPRLLWQTLVLKTDGGGGAGGTERRRRMSSLFVCLFLCLYWEQLGACQCHQPAMVLAVELRECGTVAAWEGASWQGFWQSMPLF